MTVLHLDTQARAVRHNGIVISDPAALPNKLPADTHLKIRQGEDLLLDFDLSHLPSNIRVSSYGNKYGVYDSEQPKPILQKYFTFTDPADFTEDPTDAGTWIHLSPGLARHIKPIGFGLIGNVDEPSFEIMGNYWGWGSGEKFNSVTWQVPKRWDSTVDWGAGWTTKLAIYTGITGEGGDPVSQFGTIYYTIEGGIFDYGRHIQQSFEGIKIENIKFKNCYSLLFNRIPQDDVTTALVNNTSITHCDGEHCIVPLCILSKRLWIGRSNIGTDGFPNLIATDNTCKAVGGHSFMQCSRSSSGLISRNKIDGIGYAEAGGGIYGNMGGFPGKELEISFNEFSTFIPNAIRWVFEQHGIYPEWGSRDIRIFGNAVDGVTAGAGIHSNSASPDMNIWAFSNLITNCKQLYNQSGLQMTLDAPDGVEHRDLSNENSYVNLWNNTGIGLTSGVQAITDATRPGGQYAHNNVVIANPDAGAGGAFHTTPGTPSDRTLQSHNTALNYSSIGDFTDGGSSTIDVDPEIHPTLGIAYPSSTCLHQGAAVPSIPLVDFYGDPMPLGVRGAFAPTAKAFAKIATVARI